MQAMALSAALPASDSNFPCFGIMVRLVGFVVLYFVALLTACGAVFLFYLKTGNLVFFLVYSCGVILLIVGGTCLIGLGKQFSDIASMPQLVYGLIADICIIGVVICVFYFPNIWVIGALVLVQFVIYLFYIIGFVPGGFSVIKKVV